MRTEKRCDAHKRSLLGTPALAWLVPFLLLATIGCCWALSSPVLSAPDEPAHVIKAAAVARGEIIVKSVPENYYTTGQVRVPAAFAETRASRFAIPVGWT